MNHVIIFAGGIGSRMGSKTPKQFLEINSKPILIHTLEKFNFSDFIDTITIVTIKEYIETVKHLVAKFSISKVDAIIEGGDTAFSSQFNGVNYINCNYKNSNDVVLIHDGVRPFINDDLIKKCILNVMEKGTAVTVSPAAETIAIKSGASIEQTLPRENCLIARAPQCFYLKDIYEAHLLARKNKKTYIDSASMLLDQGKTLNPVMGPDNNIKITTPYDYELAKLLLGDK